MPLIVTRQGITITIPDGWRELKPKEPIADGDKYFSPGGRIFHDVEVDDWCCMPKDYCLVIRREEG
jgi:hypothetical protein